ncbi:MAG TPA: hypothetical protein VLJ62_03315 [Burkholderiaceae bacterium]|nr:hypothetical protein [Burkholderiaceae bacterium]
MLDNIGIVKSLQSLWGKTKQDITDSGLSLNGTVGDLSGGRGVRQYADVSTTKSSWFGLVKKTTNDTQFADVSAELSAQFGLVFKNVGNVLKAGASSLGRDGEAVGQAVAQFVVDIPRLSLLGLEGDELQGAINTAISAMADNVARAALGGLESFQQLGEGYFETITRMAAGIESADYELEKLGLTAIAFTDVANKQGDIAAEIVRQSIMGAETAAGALSNVGKIISTFDGHAGDIAGTYAALVDVRDALRSAGESGEALSVAMIRGAGGLDALSSSLGDYFGDFFTKQERTAAGMARLGEEFARLGYRTVPKTRAEFRALVESLDPLTEDGARAYAAVIGLAGAFADLVPAAEAAEAKVRTATEIAQERAGLESQLLQLQGNTVELRKRERAALDETNRALHDQINALTDLKSMVDSLRSAVDAAMAGVEASVKARQDALKDAYDVQIGQLDAAKDAAQARFDAISEQLDAERDAAKAIFDAQTSAIKAAMDALDTAAEEQAKRYTDDSKALRAERDAAVSAFKTAAAAFDETIKAQTATVSKLKGLNDALGSTLRAMRPIGSEGADRSRAQQQIAAALAIARAGGVLPSADDLKDALGVVSKPSEDLFGSFEDYLRDFYSTSIDIRDLGNIAGEQLAGAETELQATIAMRDTLQQAHEANIERLDGLKDALDLANEQARESLQVQRDALQSQLDNARATYDAKLTDIDGRRDAAKDVLDHAIESIDGQRAALKEQLDAQLAALDDILAAARLQYEALLGIDSSVKPIPAALAALTSALGALGAITHPTGTGSGTGTVGTGTPATKTGEWVTTGQVQTWADTAGAVAVKTTGQAGTDAVIQGTNGAVLTVGQAQQYVNDNIGTNAAGVATAAQQTGISAAGVDALMGYTAGTFAAITGTGKVASASGGYTAAEIRDFVNAMLAQNNPQAIYDRAKAEHISAASLDAIMGWAAGTANDWARSQNLPAFAAGGNHSGGARLVGERGPEVEVTGPARIWSFEQTRQMLNGEGGSAALVAEVQKLRAEVSALRAESRAQQQAIAVNTGKTSRLHERWDGDGMPEVRAL